MNETSRMAGIRDKFICVANTFAKYSCGVVCDDLITVIYEVSSRGREMKKTPAWPEEERVTLSTLDQS